MSECLLCTGPLGGDVFPFATCFGGKTYRYRACPRCGSSTIDPLPSPAELTAMYRQDEYHGLFYSQEEEGADTLLGSYVPQQGGEPRRILDFGCGNGQFLKLAKALGFEAEGVELDPAVRARAAEASGCAVHALDTLQQSGRKFDLIHLGDVLEHVPDPAATMRDLEPLLADGGRFFIEGPLETNASLVRAASVLFGGLRKRLGRMAVGSFPPYHLFQTNARAQRAFFETRLGYGVERFEVWETGWPYRARGPAQSVAARVRGAIGDASVLVARSAGPRMQFGNRFAALLRPGEAQRVSSSS